MSKAGAVARSGRSAIVRRAAALAAGEGAPLPTPIREGGPFEQIGTDVGPLWMPEMIAFRRDGRFQDFVRDLGLIDYWRERGPPDGYELQGERLLLP